MSPTVFREGPFRFFSDQDLKVVLELVVAREQEIRDAWIGHFGS